MSSPIGGFRGDLGRRIDQRAGTGQLFGCDDRPSAAPTAPGFHDSRAGEGALSDQILLEISEGGEQVERRPTRGSSGADDLSPSRDCRLARAPSGCSPLRAVWY